MQTLRHDIVHICSRPAAKIEHADHVNLYVSHTLRSPGPLPVVREWKKMCPWMTTLLTEKSTFMTGINDLLQLYNYTKQNNSIISVQVCFAQLRKALLELMCIVNLEQCTTSLYAQEFVPLPYWLYVWY